MTLIKTVYEVAKIALKYGNRAGKFTSGQTTFIRHFPPAYRRDVRTILKGVSTVTTGGIIADVIKDYMQAPDTPGNGSFSPFTPSSKQNKTRNRFSTRSSRRYKNRNYCYPRKRYSRPRNNKRSSNWVYC